MGCFLIVTERDLAQFTATMEAGTVHLNAASPGRALLRVDGMGSITPRELAASIRRAFPETSVSNTPQLHHIFPLFGQRSATYTPEPFDRSRPPSSNEDYFNFWHTVGIDPHEWTVPVEPRYHGSTAARWNDIWKAWIDLNYQTATGDQVRQWGWGMLEYFGLDDSTSVGYYR